VKKNGFTLMELMIVIGIIAILVALASVKIGGQLSKARDGKAIAILGTWRTANHLVYTENSIYSLTFGDLESRVDKQTVALTFADVNKSIFSGASIQWLQSGKSNNINSMVSITITGTAIESFIIFDDSNGNDTKGTSWSAY